MKTIINLIFLTTLALANNIILQKQIKVYQVPLQYSNNISQINQNGAVIKEKNIIKQGEIWQDKNILIVYKTKDNQKIMISLLNALKEKTKNPNAVKLIKILKKVIENND